MPLRWAWAAAGGVLALMTLPREAGAADDKRSCILASEKAQELRKDGQLMAARREALACSSDACPTAIREDCAMLAQALAAKIPSIVLRVRTPGGDDVTDARLTLDGQPLGAIRPGRAIDVDPGTHTVRVDRAGAAPLEKTFVAAEGESARVVELLLTAAAPAAKPHVEPVSAGPAAEPTAAAAGERPRGRPVPVGAWVAGGVGVLGVVGFTYFGLRVHDDLSILRERCSPHCTDEQVAPLNARRVAADVSLGVGVIGLGVATWLFLSSRSRPAPPAVAVVAAPAPGGATLGASGRF